MFFSQMNVNCLLDMIKLLTKAIYFPKWVQQFHMYSVFHQVFMIFTTNLMIFLVKNINFLNISIVLETLNKKDIKVR